MVAEVVLSVMGKPVGPAPCKPVELLGPRGRGTDQDKARGFPSGPGASTKLLTEAEYTTATGFPSHRQTALRSGLGPYTTVRIHSAPPTSPRSLIFCREMREISCVCGTARELRSAVKSRHPASTRH